MNEKKKRKPIVLVIEILLLLVLAVALICIFLFANGVPAMKEIGFVKFLTGTVWRPNNDIYGISPMIMGTP